jgi:hypothetical protein
MELRNWYPEHRSSGSWIVFGSVYGSDRFGDGMSIHTSRVSSLSVKDGRIFITTIHSTYELIIPLPRDFYEFNSPLTEGFLLEFTDSDTAAEIMDRLLKKQT